MSGDLHSTVTTDLGSSIGALQKLRAAYEALGVTMGKVNAAGAKLKDLATKGIGKPGQQAGQALQRTGGIFGSTIGQITGGFGGDGVFARLAVVAGLASVAWKAFNAVAEANIDRTRKLIDAEKELRDVRSAARQDLDKQARAGEQQAEIQRKLLAAGGTDARRFVEGVSSSGVVARGDAEKGVLTAYQKAPPGTRTNAIVLAQELADLGVNFADAMDEIVKGPALTNFKTADSVKRSIFATTNGITGDNATIDAAMEAAAARVANDPFLRATRQAAGIRSQEYDLNRGRATERSVGLARQDIAAAKDPESARMLELFRRQSEQNDELIRLAEAQGKVAGLVADVFSPGGSFETQLRRLANARGGAAFNAGD